MTNKKFLSVIGTLYLILSAGMAWAITCGSRGGTPIERYTVAGVEVYCLDSFGGMTSSSTIQTSTTGVFGSGLKIGNSVRRPTTVPTNTTGVNFGIKVPYVNAAGATISAGSIVIGTTITAVAAATNAPGVAGNLLATNTVVGVNEFDLAAGATGYMTVAGYALCLTTGTVSVGDIIVTTNTASVNGYGGAVAPSSSTLNGSIVGIARQAGTAAGGLTLIQLSPR